MIGARFMLHGKEVVVYTGDGWHERALKCALVLDTQYDTIQVLPGVDLDCIWMDVDLDFFPLGMIKFM